MFAHSNVLYGVDLSFNTLFEEGVVQSAKDFFNTTNTPSRIDYEHEALIVNFESDKELYAIISPIDFSVIGFRNNSLISAKSQAILFSKEARRAKAEAVFQTLANRLRQELVYGEEVQEYSGQFRHTWYRQVEGILVANDYFEVEVDGHTGDIVSWRAPLFIYQKSAMTLTPAISYRVAQYIAEIRFNAKPTDTLPVLVIEKTRPLWLVKVKALYPIYVAVDALTGRVVYSGNPRSPLPVDYDAGRDVAVIKTDYIKQVYSGDL
ncbi:hypothetical protein COT72_00170 [archaeon CG10_big_fil_rev_8_21_14_0_10_43_11]|nr:MAG: hypothetical protein COT72_00170 [archaeon CG10_big_fil_rev_8_21_14_0_10_43_11]